MIATERTKFDGIVYEKGDNIPDLGSITCVSTDGKIRNYEGNLADESKLDNITYAPEGSECLLSDGTETLVKHFIGGAWIKL